MNHESDVGSLDLRVHIHTGAHIQGRRAGSLTAMIAFKAPDKETLPVTLLFARPQLPQLPQLPIMG